MDRSSSGSYTDPLDLVWRRCAERLGWRLHRDDAVFASWDGRGTLRLCPEDDYDPDDSLAQLVLHEACHALVQGPARRHRLDWGLFGLDDDASALAEHACHRLQAALLDRYGLREVLAVTTDWRPYWEALPADPLAAGDDPAIALAVAAWPEAVRGPWSAALDDALRATAAIVAATAPHAPEDSLFAGFVGLHPLGEALGDEAATCATCAWRTPDDRCRARADEGTPGPRLDPTWRACLRHEPRLDASDCAACGACCREGYGLVPAETDGPLATQRPDLVTHDPDLGPVVPRPGGRCVALAGADGPPWRCAVYALRPRSCRDFAVGGAACLTARRRVGLSRR